jgi:hypothetical protein
MVFLEIECLSHARDEIPSLFIKVERFYLKKGVNVLFNNLIVSSNQEALNDE